MIWNVIGKFHCISSTFGIHPISILFYPTSFLENYTDRHNIFLFLMRDTMREHPIGFEKEHRNIFDPEEDPAFLEPPVQEEAAAAKTDVDFDNTKPEVIPVTTAEASPDGETTKPENVRPVCGRKGCLHLPRFDSLFCSDSCGVSALELDLLHSFQESSDIHPSILRN